MIITKIEKQKKGNNRYNIFLDGEFAFGLYKDTIADFGLRVNDLLDEFRIARIKESDEFNFSKRTAFKYLSYKSRSKKDVYKKLKEKKISDETIRKVISYLEEQKFLDDRAYAKMFVQSQLLNKPIGKKTLTIKLMQKGFDKELIEEILENNFSEETEIENAKKLLKKYSLKIKSEDPFKKRKKSFAYLVSRGFDYEIVNRLLDSESI